MKNYQKQIAYIYIKEIAKKGNTQAVAISKAISVESNTNVETYVDGNKVNSTNTRIERPDVISGVTGYGDISVNPKPGFENKINLTSLSNGRHTITLKLKTKYGDIIDSYSKVIHVYNNISFGVDVSQYNGTLDWNSLKYNGVTFAIVRAGYRGYGTNGTLVTDSKLSENVIRAHNAGIKVGVYFFTQATSYDEGVEEANYVLNLIGRKGQDGLNKYITLPIVIDSENSTGYPHGRADMITNAARTSALSGFLTTIQNAGYKPMIYASKFWFRDRLNMLLLNNYSVWLAHYTYSVDIQSDYTGMYEIWQYSNAGSIPGASGAIDLDIGYGI